MSVFAKIEKGKYIDSLETLFSSSVLNEQPGISAGYIGMGTEAFKAVASDLGLMTEAVAACGDGDYVTVAEAESEEAFLAALAAVEAETNPEEGETEKSVSYPTIAAAAKAVPKANLVQISVPGEYALEQAKEAFAAGLHACVFSNNVPTEDEREMKEIARQKGLLCMGPDCGVANINGAALVLASVNNRGPYGIVGASGVGIQHVAAILHANGTGVSQTIGTGGNDIKEGVDGIMLVMGLDALDADPETKYIGVVARKCTELAKERILARIAACSKPVVVNMMSATKEEVEAAGAIYAANLDECGAKLLLLTGKTCRMETEEELTALAATALEGMSAEQKYVRGAFSGGTFMDEATRTLWDRVGGVWSNSSFDLRHKLADAKVSQENSCVDWGEEEFTNGRPHPAIDPSVRKPAILKEAADPEVAVILLDFILTPPGYMDPVGYVLEDIKKAQEMAAARGGKIAFVASVLGTDADFQNKAEQEKKLRDAGVLVASSNYRAAMLAGEIIRLKNGRPAVESAAEDPAAVQARVDAVLAAKADAVYDPSANSCDPSKMIDLFRSEFVMVNVGPKAFGDVIEKQGYRSVQVDWRPVAGGDKRMQEILAAIGGF